MKEKGVPEEAIDVTLASITEGTLKQYTKGLKLWWDFCHKKQFSVFKASTTEILQFFAEILPKTGSYSTLNGYRAAISLILENEIGKDQKISRFFKGVSNLKPQKAKYATTWDPALVLKHLENFFPNESISLENLTKKLATLLALTTAQRVQTLSKIDLNNITRSENLIQIFITDRIKTSGLNKAQPVLNIPVFKEQEKLCVASTLSSYIKRTKALRGKITKLFITHKKPHHIATSQTISRWIKQTLTESGINTNHFSSHSTRHSATSTAARKGINIEVIRKAAGWSENSTTFARFYNRPVQLEGDFALAVLSENQK